MESWGAGKLRSALEAEREIVRMKTHFLHSVSHEFRTPLSVIQSGAELIEHYADQLTPERRAQALTQIKASTQQMNEMVEQVLTLSRIESGQLPIQHKFFSVADLCADMVRSVSTSTQERCPIMVRCELSCDFQSDATLLRSIVSNLLTNAVKYSNAGSSITLAATQNDAAISIVLRDQGMGITPDDLPHVQEPFHRGANAGDIPGTGLGLAIASKCAALLGGSLKLDSIEGKGTTAIVTLPLV